jgi:uncharacterized membrane protein YeiB
VPASSPTSRLEGLDLARALAFAGMLLAHVALTRGGHGEAWVRVLQEGAEGRAASLFALLLGVGAGLLTARGDADVVVVRRGVLLLLLGLVLWPSTPVAFVILPQFGLALALVPALRRLADGHLLAVAGAAFATPSLVRALTVHDHLRSSLGPPSWRGLADVDGVLRAVCWTGAHPLVGWIGFVLVGLSLSRRLPRTRGAALRLAAAGVAVAATQPLWSAARQALGGVPAPGHAAGAAAFFDASAGSDMLAWYVLSTATALAVVGLCLVLAPRRAPEPLQPLVQLGQLALTAYVADVALGRGWLWDRLDDARPTRLGELVAVVLVVAACAAVATAWRRRFRHGPLEAALRLAAG